jgi:HAD superfamily hydrolase (TIGR01490 family)
MAADPLLTVPERRVIAVFDLDGTLTRGDTLLPFLWWALGPAKFLLRLPRALPWLAGLVLGLVPRDRAKEGVLTAFLRGELREDLERKGATFARDRLPSMLRPGAAQRLAWHKSRHHHCALASASPDAYVQAWAKSAGFDDVFCTRLDYADGVATGRFVGHNCRAEEKLRRLEEGYGDLSRLVLHGYGDTADDRPFLDRCAESHYKPFQESAHGSMADYIKLMRPHQWVKNGFVFVGLIFGHAWGVPALLFAAILAAAAFSLMSSAIYILNDFADRERDRMHPVKRQRPLAAGRVSPRSALYFAAMLAIVAALLAFAAGPLVLAIVAGYAAMNVAYSFGLKNQVILDVFIIATGFLLRILAGTAGIGIAPSKWLLVCGLFLTLFLGFTKRRSELLVVKGDFITHRKALLHYSPALLDKIIAVSAGATLMSYSLYAMSPETVRMHGTENLIYTIPFVAYGLFRYLYLLHARQAGTDTSRDMFRDWHLAGTVLAWLVVTVLLIA